MTKGVASFYGRDQASIAAASGVTPRWPMPPTDVSWRLWPAATFIWWRPASAATLTGEAVAELDALCHPSTSATGSRAAAFNPVALATAALFAAVLSGDFAINGFRNRDLQGKLYPAAATDATEATRRTHRTSRLIAKLRGHGLIAKVKNSRLYRINPRGYKAMGAAVRFRKADFPSHFRDLQAALVPLAA